MVFFFPEIEVRATKQEVSIVNQSFKERLIVKNNWKLHLFMNEIKDIFLSLADVFHHTLREGNDITDSLAK